MDIGMEFETVMEGLGLEGIFKNHFIPTPLLMKFFTRSGSSKSHPS